jgi:hypothetical protein
LDIVQILSQIAGFVSDRQIVLKSLVGSIKNLQQGLKLNQPNTTQDIFSGGLSDLGNVFNTGDNKREAPVGPNDILKIPTELAHLIENENEDDLGIGSAKRFVIRGNRIHSLNISEKEPTYTSVTVKGLFGQGFVDQNIPDLTADTHGGNQITTAYAVDYDTWNMYGFRGTSAIEAPFFSNPETQCAPYAVSLLTQARKNILQGSVEINGYNEYYQPGDVVYIEDKNLLFYVTSVTHNFNYGNLSTSLELRYGHSPGEYIPNMLDLIGKTLYNTRGVSSQLRNNRYNTYGSATSLGAIVFDVPPSQSFSDTDGPLAAILQGTYGERNKNILADALFSTSGSLNQVNYQRVTPKIKIRYYIPNINEDTIKQVAFAIKGWFTNPQGFSNETQTLFGFDKKNVSYNIQSSDILIEEYDFNIESTPIITQIDPESNDVKAVDQGPSQAAWAVTRDLEKSAIGNSSNTGIGSMINSKGRQNSSSYLSPDQLRDLLSAHILDIFVSYESVTDTVIKPSAIGSIPTDQAGQAADAAINAARPTK